jgi:hypothetical protein
VNAIAPGRVHAVSRCGTAAGEHGTYVLTTDDLSGRAVHVDAIKPTLKAPGTKLLTLKCAKSL